jgi:release factor glutamine methyltransferase
LSEARRFTTLGLAELAAGYLRERGIRSARLDSELLLAHVLGVERLALYTGFDLEVQAPERTRYRELVRRRGQEREPLAYLVGTREFWSRPFRVTPATLIPRPETERLVETVLALPGSSALELGVGSGAISVTLALERPDLRLVATDKSLAALEVAASNARTLQAAERVRLVCGDGFEAIRGCFDLVISNPPYVQSDQLAALEPELRHEPRLALDGGMDGLDLIRQLVREAPSRLHARGCLAFEFGEGQAQAVGELLRDAGARHLEIQKDLAGKERVAVARF